MKQIKTNIHAIKEGGQVTINSGDNTLIDVAAGEIIFDMSPEEIDNNFSKEDIVSAFHFRIKHYIALIKIQEKYINFLKKKDGTNERFQRIKRSTLKLFRSA